ncbi:MAG TPA: lipoyl(octanoyl) transferase LipB [Polyangiaceae bacterium]
MTLGDPRRLSGIWLGKRPYGPVLALQERLREARADGRIEDVVLLLEHHPVVTLGRGADVANVLLGADALAARGFECVRTSRGGDVTLHAPGQLVGYPIVDLRPDRCDVRRYVKDLGEVMRRLALRHGVAGGPVDGLIGLWVDRQSVRKWDAPDPSSSKEGAARDLSKLGAIGVRVSQWVTMHGFALNLTTNTDLFQIIVPCGIREHGVTSILELTGRAPDPREEAVHAHSFLADVLGRELGVFADWSDRPLATDLPDEPGAANPNVVDEVKTMQEPPLAGAS